MKCPKCGKNLLNPFHALMGLCDWLSGFFGRLAYFFDHGKWP